MEDNKYFVLKDGTFEMEADQLVITDEAKKRYRDELISCVSIGIYSVCTALSGYNNHEMGWVIFGVVLALCCLVTFLLNVFNVTTDSSIRFNEIDRIEFKKRSPTGRIINTNGKVRLFQMEDKELICSSLIEKLRQKKLKVID